MIWFTILHADLFFIHINETDVAIMFDITFPAMSKVVEE